MTLLLEGIVSHIVGFEGTVSHVVAVKGVKGHYRKLSFWHTISYVVVFKGQYHRISFWRDGITSCLFEGIVSHVVVLTGQYHILSFWTNSIACFCLTGQYRKLSLWRDSIALWLWKDGITRFRFAGRVSQDDPMKISFSSPEQSSLVCCCSRISFSFLKTHGYSSDFDCLAVSTSSVGRWNRRGHRTATNILQLTILRQICCPFSIQLFLTSI